MGEWKEYKFSELLEEPVRNGIYKKKEFHGRGTKIVNMGELFSYPRLIDIEMKLVELNENEKNKCLLRNGDLIFARRSLTAEGAGKCSLIYRITEDVTFESSIIRARPNQEKVSPEFLYYYFNSPYGSYLLGTILRQVAVSGITGTDLMELKLNIPDKDIQENIAQIFRDLDDKIDLLHRQNKTLEALAETLFRQWFVEPVRRGGEADGGWEKSQIGKVLQTELGGTPSTTRPEYWDGDIPWINSGELNEFRIVRATRFITGLGLEKSSTKLMPKGTTVLAITGATLGQISLLEIETCANQSVVGIIPNERIPKEYVFLWVKYKIEDIILSETGGAQPHINKNDINETEIIIPPADLLKEKNKILKQYFDKITINTFHIHTLTQLRDTLLPKLMSGEVRVKN